MVSTKLIIIESTLGKFAFTYDKKDNLIYQELEKQIKYILQLIQMKVEICQMIGKWLICLD